MPCIMVLGPPQTRPRPSRHTCEPNSEARPLPSTQRAITSQCALEQPSHCNSYTGDTRMHTEGVAETHYVSISAPLPLYVRQPLAASFHISPAIGLELPLGLCPKWRLTMHSLPVPCFRANGQTNKLTTQAALADKHVPLPNANVRLRAHAAGGGQHNHSSCQYVSDLWEYEPRCACILPQSDRGSSKADPALCFLRGFSSASTPTLAISRFKRLMASARHAAEERACRLDCATTPEPRQFTRGERRHVIANNPSILLRQTLQLALNLTSTKPLAQRSCNTCGLQSQGALFAPLQT